MPMLKFYSFATLENLCDDMDIYTVWKIGISRSRLQSVIMNGSRMNYVVMNIHNF
jgi:hypothetical protein